MTEQITLTQLAAEMARLQKQVEQVNQRLDMIYGAITRLAETQPGSAPANPEHSNEAPAVRRPAAPASPSFSAEMMMAPGSMLDSLRQFAQNAGLSISTATVERLKSNLPAEQQDEPA